MGNFIWLLNKNNDSSIIWSGVFSVIFHFLLLSVLVIKPVFPSMGDRERIDIIWLYSNHEPSGQPAAFVPPDKGRLRVVNNDGRSISVNKDNGTQETYREDKASLDRENRTEKVVNQSQVLQEAGKESEQATEILIAKAGKQKISMQKEGIHIKAEPEAFETKSATREKHFVKDEAAEGGDRKNNPTIDESIEKLLPEAKQIQETVKKKAAEIRPLHANKASTEIPFAPGHSVQSVADDAKEMKTPPREKSATTNSKSKTISLAGHTKDPVAGNSEKPHEINSSPMEAVKAGKSILQTVERHQPASQEKVIGTTLGKLVAEIKNTGIQAKTRQLFDGNNGTISGEEKIKQGGTTTKPTEKESVNNAAVQNPVDDKTNGTAGEDKGISLPPLVGDLKLQMSGDTNLVITVHFKEYLKARRYKAMTKAEAKRVQSVTPLTRTREKTVEAVVGATGEGVYNFVVEPENNKTAKAIFLLKIYENRRAGRTVPIGIRTVSGKTVIAKILMPEGIVWEDDSYFSGYMEDSDSITKYNSETGLVWKEYRDE
jgi:hypothetical protein